MEGRGGGLEVEEVWGRKRKQRRSVEGVEESWRSSRVFEPLTVSACSFKQNSSSKCGASGYRLVKLQRRL